MSLAFTISDVTGPEVERYIFDKLNRFLTVENDSGSYSEEEVRDQAELMLQRINEGSKNNDLLSIDRVGEVSGNGENIDPEIRAVMSEIEDLSMLLPGEVVEKMEVGTLAKAIPGIGAGSPILIQRTNMATLHFLPILENSEPPTLAATNLSPEAGMEKLISGLVDLAPPPFNLLGSALLAFIWPGDDSKAMFEALIDRFSEIVEKANINQTVSEQTGELTAYIRNISTYYMRRKESGASKEDLFRLLETKYVLDIPRVMGVLEQKSFEKVGLATYVSGVNVYFNALQEMALVYPQGKPEDAPSLGTIQDNVETYVKHASRVLPIVKDDRMNQRLDKIVKKREKHCSGAAGGFCTYHPYFEDEESGYRSGTMSQGERDREMEKYKDRIRSEFSRTLEEETRWMSNSIETWKKLKTQPLPPQP